MLHFSLVISFKFNWFYLAASQAAIGSYVGHKQGKSPGKHHIYNKSRTVHLEMKGWSA